MNKNHNFGYVIGDLFKPIYVLQMARSKNWSTERRIYWLKEFQWALRRALSKVDKALKEEINIRQQESRNKEH